MNSSRGETLNERRFLQSRLALLGKVGGLLGAVALVISYALLLAMSDSISAELVGSGYALQAAPTLAMIAVAWLCSRTRLRYRHLLLIDVCLTLVIYTIMAVLPHAITIAGSAGPSSEAAAGFLTLSFLRALLLPSTGRRTLILSVVGALITFIGVVSLMGEAEASSALTIVSLAIWSGIGIAVSTFASRVLYGLRDRVRRAHALGQYEIVGRIGAGSMGEVFLAKHALLQRPTAVKVLRAERADDQLVRRFEREVQRTCQLTHPNTVAIYDYGRTAAGDFFYAMEYLEGKNLDQLIADEGPLTPARTVHLMEQLLSALAEAHDQRIIHRDIKPGNLIVGERGGLEDVLKVVDFGLVKELLGESDASIAGTIVGTPHYMAPEQVRGSATIDERADLYSVGAVAYFLLSGQRLFPGANVGELMYHHLATDPRPIFEVATQPLPAALSECVMLCLRKDPAERPSSARSLRDRFARSLRADAVSREGLGASVSHLSLRTPRRSQPLVTDPLAETIARTPRSDLLAQAL